MDKSNIMETKTTTITIQNLKCGGCATQIISKLSQIEGISNVSVDELTSTVTFEYETDKGLEEVSNTLTEIGYPQFDESNSLGTKAKSYLNCMVGRVKNIA